MKKVSIICILFIKSYNQIRINYRTKLFYKIVYTDQEFDKVQNYYLMKNVQKYLYISKLINEKYINIFIVIIFFDVLILIIGKFNKKYVILLMTNKYGKYVV